MRRLNVRFSQIRECIQKSLFAVDSLPRNPPLRKGELLLLQLVKNDATDLGKLDARVEFALVFDHFERDPGGLLSKQHWPDAGKVWEYLLVCSDTLPAIPFSLERLGLKNSYAGQTQCLLVEPSDDAIVAERFSPRFESLATTVNNRTLLSAIRNYDVLLRISPTRVTQVSEHSRRVNDPWPSDALKTLYDHRCQVCTHDFKPRYNVPHADVRFIMPVEAGGSLESRNRLVVCPNHNTIISVAHGEFDEPTLSLRYPNGLVETLQLIEHLTASAAAHPAV